MKKLSAALTTIGLLFFAGCQLLESSDEVDPPVVPTDTGYRGVVSSPTTWATANATYQITGTLDIQSTVVWGPNIKVVLNQNVDVVVRESGKLTILEGVEIQSAAGASFEIGRSSSGTLIVQGSALKPVVFTKSPGVANWGSSGWNGAGLILGGYITSSTALDYCVVQYATTGIFCDEIALSMTNSKVLNNSAAGIYFYGTAEPKDLESFTLNEFRGNGTYPIMCEAQALRNLPGNLVFGSNGKNGIQVDGGTATTSGTWHKMSIPYLITRSINIENTTGVTITLEPGVECLFSEDVNLRVGSGKSGTLIANGVEGDSIIFRNAAVDGQWGTTGWNGAGISIGSLATSTVSLSYCVVENATNGIFVDDIKPTISHCRVSTNSMDGIYFYGESSPKDSASFIDNVITGNSDFGIHLPPAALGNLSGTGSVAGNSKGGIVVEGGNDVKSNAIWKKHDAPYVVKEYIDIENQTGVTVTIRPGVRMEFIPLVSLRIGTSYAGTLIANGSVEQPIVFTSAVDGSFWGTEGWNGAGISIGEATGANTSLSFCTIEKATTGIFAEKNAAVTNCVIRDNESYGVYAYPDATVAHYSDATNTFSGNGTEDVYTE